MRKIEIPKEELERLYIKDKLTLAEVGKIFSTTQATVTARIREYGIHLRSKSEAHVISDAKGRRTKPDYGGDKNPNFRHGLYIQERIYRKMVEIDSCAKCGSSDKLIVHHKNLDHLDNHQDNLEVLCRGCHQSLHKSIYWKRVHGDM